MLAANTSFSAVSVQQHNMFPIIACLFLLSSTIQKDLRKVKRKIVSPERETPVLQAKEEIVLH